MHPPSPTYGFIGAGHMATALIQGLLNHGVFASAIWACSPRGAPSLAKLAIHTSTDNRLACQQSMVILAVKPALLKTLCQDLGAELALRKPLIISVAAGIRCAQLQAWLGYEATVIRMMPNTPALIQQGATGLFAAPSVPPEQRTQAETLAQCLGLALWLEQESWMDIVTALSGSGPAYFFYWVEALIEGALTLGLPHPIAQTLAHQTFLGAATLLCTGSEDAATLKERVTSPQGTTAAALGVFDAAGQRELIIAALTAARDRSRALAQALERE